MNLLLLCIPWLLVGLFLVLFVRIPPRMPPPPVREAEDPPLASITIIVGLMLVIFTHNLVIPS